MTAILELQNIRLSLTNSRGERYELLRGVNLAVEKGGVTALVGGNGTGKTTLFNIISGVQPAYRGDIRFEGQLLNRMPAHRISQRGIGRLFQGGQLLAGLTLMENMKMASSDRFRSRRLDGFAVIVKKKSRKRTKPTKSSNAFSDPATNTSACLTETHRPSHTANSASYRWPVC